MRVPTDPDELWRRDEETDDDQRKVPTWVEWLANVGIALALAALAITPIGLGLLYLQLQPYANITIVAAMMGALVGLALSFGERVAKAGDIRI
ncbi:MAG: hypothetical protein ACOC0X_06470 [Halobacteriota archaeon]